MDVVYGHRIIINEQDQEIGRWVLPPHNDQSILWKDYIPQETLFWRRSLWEKIGGRMDESFHFALDWDLLIRFQTAGAKFSRLPRFLAAFRLHAGQKTSTQIHTVGLSEEHRLLKQVHAREVGRRPRPAQPAQAGFTRSAPHRLRRRTPDAKFLFVSDLVDGLIALARSQESRPTNVGNPIERSVLEIATAVNELTGNKAGVTFLPLPENDPKVRRPDITRAKSFGWEPKGALEHVLKESL